MGYGTFLSQEPLHVSTRRLKVSAEVYLYTFPHASKPLLHVNYCMYHVSRYSDKPIGQDSELCTNGNAHPLSERSFARHSLSHLPKKGESRLFPKTLENATNFHDENLPYFTRQARFHTTSRHHVLHASPLCYSPVYQHTTLERNSTSRHHTTTYGSMEFDALVERTERRPSNYICRLPTSMRGSEHTIHTHMQHF